MTHNLHFSPISILNRGSLFKILKASYSDLINKYDAKNKNKYLESWKRLDDNAFNNSKIGECVNVT